MKRLVRLGVVVCALSVPVVAQAEEIQPMGWTADGNVVVFVADPLGMGETFGASADSFYLACTPGDIGAGSWNQGCTVCGGTDAGPADCGLTDTKWKKLKAAKKSPDKKIAVSTKRTCTGKGDEKACKTAITVGKIGTVTIDDADAKHKAVVTAYFRKDSGAVVLVSTEQSASDQAIQSRSLLVIATAAAAEPAAGGASAFLKKWDKMADKVCKCKTAKCLEGLQQELLDMAATAEQDAAGITAEEGEQLQRIVDKMKTCADAIAQSGK